MRYQRSVSMVIVTSANSAAYLGLDSNDEFSISTKVSGGQDSVSLSNSSTAGTFSEAADALMEALTNVGHPLPTLIQPGLSDAAIDELMAPTGLSLPDEARALWQWSNGFGPARNDGPLGAQLLPGGIEMLDLSSAVSGYIEHVESFPWTDVPLHSKSWLSAFVAGQDDYWLDTSVDAGAPCPVRRIYRADMWTTEILQRQTVPSLTAAFDDMRSAVVDGAWTVIDRKAPAGSTRERMVFWGVPDDAKLPGWM